MSDLHAIVLAFHYPPSKEVGGIRAEKVTQMLRAAGYRVTVITRDIPEPLTEPADSGIEVVRVRPARGPRSFYSATRRYLRQKTGPGHSPAASPLPVGGSVPRVGGVKRIINAFGALPDEHQGFVLAAWRAARHARTRSTRLVYSTAPPFSSHLAALLLKWTTSMRWIAEFRDPWTDNAWRPAHRQSGITDAISRWMERRCLRNADLVVTVAERAAERMKKRLSAAHQDRVVTVRNGIDTLQRPTPGTNAGPFRIVHVGSFYHQRNPGPFLSGLANLARQHGLTGDQLRVELVGNCRWFRGESVEQQAAALGLEPFMSFQDWVPHTQAQDLISSANLLLLLAQEQPLQVPNKLYEYLGTGIPILAFAEPESETAEMLRRVGGHWLVSSTEPAEIQRIMETALGLGMPASVAARDWNLLEEWTTSRQMTLLRQYVERITGSRNGAGAAAPPLQG